MTTDRRTDVTAAAREWLLRLSLESSTPADRERFNAWRAEDPRHAEAYERIESIWHDAATLTELAHLAALPATPDRWTRRALCALRARPLIWATCVGIVASISALGVWRLTSPTHFETGVAEVREIRLTDGSEVTLGACTSIDVAFRGDERRVTLNEGEVFFSVSRSLTRPFVVMIGNKEVRVLGTKFEVRRRATTIRLAVAEGKVEVIEVLAHSPTVPVTTLPGSAQLLSETTHPATVHRSDRASSTPQDAQAGAPPEDHLLTSGQQVTVALNGPIPEPEPMPLRDLAAWRHGRLVYVDAPLREVVADANRYSHESIVIGDERVADLRVSVTYPSNRVDEMLSALSRSLSIEIGRPAPGEIVLQYKGRKD